MMSATSEGPIQTDPGKRSFGEYIDDKQLRAIVEVNIGKAHEELKESRINVYTYNSVVLLTGQVSTKELRDLAAQTARKVNRVRQVYNEIQIGPQISFIDITQDNWIESKIGTKLMFNKDIDSDRVEVIVENKVVYLMGMLTQIQAEKITDVVRTTKGVTKVVRAIEYIE
ncbi:hypothetical protein TDB9533_02835 [Thalassocella blandensis]|nr:hypothetical protein TDB9533_02835 [Thalassocella blandensis]